MGRPVNKTIRARDKIWDMTISTMWISCVPLVWYESGEGWLTLLLCSYKTRPGNWNLYHKAMQKWIHGSMPLRLMQVQLRTVSISYWIPYRHLQLVRLPIKVSFEPGPSNRHIWETTVQEGLKDTGSQDKLYDKKDDNMHLLERVDWSGLIFRNKHGSAWLTNFGNFG